MQVTDDWLKKLFGANLRKYRESFGFSQLKLADTIGISANFVNNIEHGKKGASIETIARIANTLEIEPYKLFLPEWEKSLDDIEYPEHIEDFLKSVENLKSHYQ